MITVELSDSAATERLGATVGAHLEPGDVVLLTGELGAGKTTFTRGAVRRLGGGESVTSPTFTLCQLYETEPPIAHVDCWRLDGIAEVADLGLEEMLDEGTCVIAEWGDRAAPVIGDDALVVALEYLDERRTATISATGERSSERLDAIGGSRDTPMSLLLGIDTATIAVSVAIVRDGVVLASFGCPGARRQTEVLHPALELLFGATGLSPSDLDAVVADVGPGRFTGVRVGVAAAKGLAFGAGVGAVGCPSTAILLEAVRGVESESVAVVDLRRGEIAVLFSGDDPVSGTIRTTPAGLGALLVERDATGALLVGDGATEYRSAIAEGAHRDVRVGSVEFAAPNAVAACRLAERGWPDVAGGDPAALEAVYLRGADVRLGWTTRDGAVPPTRLEVG